MIAPHAPAADRGPAREWLEALVEVEHAWQAYVECIRSDATDESALARRWLRLWLAERRRDELLRADD